MRKASLIAAIAAAAAVAMPASAAQVMITNAWFRALPAKLPAGGYFELHNMGKSTIKLTAAESPACGMLMLHESKEMGGMSTMKDVSELEIPAGATFRFTPGNFHLMCMDPTKAMKPGASVDVTLRFSDGTTTATKFAVKNARGQ